MEIIPYDFVIIINSLRRERNFRFRFRNIEDAVPYKFHCRGRPIRPSVFTHQKYFQKLLFFLPNGDIMYVPNQFNMFVVAMYIFLLE